MTVNVSEMFQLITTFSFLYIIHVCISFLRKDQNLLSPVNCWYLLLNQVRRESKDHATLSEIYLNNVIMRFMQISEDSTRMFKKVMPLLQPSIWAFKMHEGGESVLIDSM